MRSNHFELIIYITIFNRGKQFKNSLNVISKKIAGLEDKIMVYMSNNGSRDS